MEQREIELTILSAQDLKNVKLSGGAMTPYAVAWISPNFKVSTPEHSQGGVNPSWNSVLRLTCDENSFQNSFITIEIYHHGSFSNKLVGTVTVPLSELNSQRQASGSEGSREKRFAAYPVRRPSGKHQGILNLSLKVGKLVKQAEQLQQAWAAPAGVQTNKSDGKDNQPVTAYPAAVPYPMSSSQAGPSGPPQQYNYPPSGYPPQYAQPGPYYQQAPPYPAPYPTYIPPPRRSGYGGAGFGTGLLGGALGGMLLGSALDGGDGCGGDWGGGCGGF